MTSPDDTDALTAVRSAQPSSHGPEGDALVVEVRASLETLARLLEHQQRFSAQVVASIRGAIADAEGRLAREELRVVVVGEPGSGKSTLLDALIGERLLGTRKVDVPVTLRWARTFDFRARLAGGVLERFAERVPDRAAPLRSELDQLENALLEVNQERPAALRELTAAGAAVEVAEDALAEIARELETIRQEAEREILARSTRDGTHAELESQAEEVERSLPVLVRKRPAWWAIWHWLLWIFLAPLALPRLRRRQHLVRELDKSRSELSSIRASSQAKAERRLALERACSEAEVPVHHARARLGVAQAGVEEYETRAKELGSRRKRLEGELARFEGERKSRFLADLTRLIDGVPGRRLVELEIDYPARGLPRDVAMIDAPGAFSNDGAAEQRFWALLEDHADACIVVSDLDRAVSGQTRTVLQRLRSTVVHAILVLTKLDQAVRTALRQGSRELSEAVEQARRIATRRFAREVGRDPETVLSVAVAAQDALEHPEETYASFEGEASKLFQLLRQERALILGSRCALVVRRCIGAAAETERQVEQTYVDRIGTLEAERRPEPGDLRHELVRAAEPELEAIADNAVTAAEGTIDDGVRLIRMECESLIFGSTSGSELRGLGNRLAQAIEAGFERARDELGGALSRHADHALESVEKNAYERLRKQYDLLPEITRTPGSTLRIELALAPPALADEPERRIAGVFRDAARRRWALLAGGAAFGLVAGTLLVPGVGSVVGALLGSLAYFTITLKTLKRSCRNAIGELVVHSRESLVRGVAASRPTIRACLTVFLDELVDRALSRFGRWIAEPLEAERRAIQAERDKLEDLQQLVARLEEHDRALQALSQAASRASLGLCR